MSIERAVIGTKYIQQDAADFDSLNIGEQFEYNDEPYIKIACYNGLPAAFSYTTGKIAWFPFVIPPFANIPKALDVPPFDAPLAHVPAEVPAPIVIG